MKVVALYSIKGGVGKTATAVNLAYLSAAAGQRTLLWDLDPQGAASFYLRVRTAVAKPKKLLRGKRPLDDAVKGSDFERLDILPADPAYRRMDLLLDEAKKPKAQLGQLIAPVREGYDLLILDCPPSLTLVSENVFRAVDALLVPVIPTPLSLRTLTQLLDFLAAEGLGDVAVWPFYALADRRKRLHQGILAAAPDPRATMLATVIPYRSEVEQMGVHRAPVAAYAPASQAAEAYAALWREAAGRLGVAS
ncbi:MAG: AAA family ATPase [Gammaproteobacteria bacterium]|nr:AAA family ATPase [Gammaproteobacteria bacterium]